MAGCYPTRRNAQNHQIADPICLTYATASLQTPSSKTEKLRVDFFGTVTTVPRNVVSPNGPYPNGLASVGGRHLRFFGRHTFSFFPGFGQTNSDRLFFARYFFAGLSAFQRSLFSLAHGLSDFIRRFSAGWARHYFLLLENSPSSAFRKPYARARRGGM